MSFYCVAADDNGVIYSWFRNDDVIHQDHVLLLSKGNLTIDSLSRGDDGIYQCMVWNAEGYDISETIQFKVNSTDMTFALSFLSFVMFLSCCISSKYQASNKRRALISGTPKNPVLFRNLTII